jgi:hypothetical protein
MEQVLTSLAQEQLLLSIRTFDKARTPCHSPARTCDLNRAANWPQKKLTHADRVVFEEAGTKLLKDIKVCALSYRARRGH